MFEKWDRDGSGLLRGETLFLRACKAGVCGEIIQYDSGCVYQAHFIYLCGQPSGTLFEQRPELFLNTPLVCMSPEWAAFLRERPSFDSMFLRRLMKPMCKATEKPLPALPAEYRLSPYDEEIFRAHPFGHAPVYSGYEDFAEHGAGAVVRHGDRILASASSYLTVGKDVELDVTTDAAYRGRGLADHCVAAMINDCAARGITVHWDAKNTPSMRMAHSHGFTLEQEYAVYILKPR